MLVDLIFLYVEQSQATQATMDSLIWFLYYMATNPYTTVHFYASDMILTKHKDTYYLSEKKSRSRSGCHFLWETKSLFIEVTERQTLWITSHGR